MDNIYVTIGETAIPSAFHQFGIFVIDGCGSMTGKTSRTLIKVEAVNMATKEILPRFKANREKHSHKCTTMVYINATERSYL